MNYKKICLVLFTTMAMVGILAGCAENIEERPSTENVKISDKSEWNCADYVSLGDYEAIEIKTDAIDAYVGDVPVGIPYRDETSITEWTLRYYYSQMNQEMDPANEVIPTDEEIVQMGIPGITTFPGLKNYVGQKVSENDNITSTMQIGDALMEQIVTISVYKEIPENVANDCESIYSDYLAQMATQYNEIGEMPSIQEGENCVHKVLAAMAIAQEVGFDPDEFEYTKVLQYLIENNEQKEVEASEEEVLSTEENVTPFIFEKELKETDNPRITLLLDVSGTHSDGFNEDNFHYQIPQFHADSESAKAVNKKIEADLSRIIDNEAEHISGGFSLVTYSVTYEIFEYGDIIAILVTIPYPNDCMDYLAYTYDFQNGKELTNTELLAMKGMTEEMFVTEVCRLQKEDFTELAKNWPNSMADQEMIDRYIENVNAYATVDLPMYLNNEGALQVYIPFASIAGADWYYQLREF